jgi:hypothetical protein
MARPFPRTTDEWLQETLLAWEDAWATKSFVRVTGTRLTDANRFELSPMVSLRLRGRKLSGKEADRVTKGALANYVVNTGPDAAVQGLEAKPRLAFAPWYVAAQLVLALVDEPTAAEILDYCEGHLPE